MSKRFRNLYLICPGSRLGPSYITAATPNLGLMALASSVYDLVDETVIVDEFTSTTADGLIEKASSKDLFGFSTALFNYADCLRLGRAAKDIGATVVFGGPHVTHRAAACAKNRRWIDHVCVGEGETILRTIVREGRSNPRIAHSDTRDSCQVHTPQIEHPIDDFPLVLGHSGYVSNVQTTITSRTPTMPHLFPIMSHKGCSWRYSNGGCLFCSLLNAKLQFISPEVLWQHIHAYRTAYSVTAFRDVGDSIGMSLSWLLRILRCRPQTLVDTQFLVYCRADELLKKGIAAALKELNVVGVYVGFESGSDRSLIGLNKGIDRETNLRALALLKEVGFRLYTSFVFGAPGETDESVQQTADFVETTRKVMGGDLVLLGANILIPYPGTTAFSKLTEIYPYLADEDLLDPYDLSRKWLEAFSCLSGPRNTWHDSLSSVTGSINAAAPSTVDLLNSSGQKVLGMGGN
jgi:radical SAM superfamily enzyme YgiQ (UPF0313 family)